MIALEADNVGFSYGEEFVLSDVSFQLMRSEVLCVLGPNGSGKTTLFNLLSGGIYPLRGSVWLLEKNLHENVHACSDSIAILPFRPPITTLRTPYLYWQAYGQRYGCTFKQVADRVALLAPQMHMESQLHTPYAKLSLGMQQKAALIAAFVPDVPVRMLDEPFSGGIDPLGMEVLATWIGNAKSGGESIIFSSQMTEHASRLADKILILKQGRLVSFGTSQQLLERTGILPTEKRSLAQAYIAVTEEEDFSYGSS